jgi:Family of unknown function (DUF5681)
VAPAAAPVSEDLPPLASIHRSLLRLAAQGPHEPVEVYLTRVASAIQIAPDAQFDRLTPDAMRWFSAAAEAIEAGKTIPLPLGYEPPDLPARPRSNGGLPPTVAKAPDVKPKPEPPRGADKAPPDKDPPVRRGGWARGVSGNPAGRPQGARNRASVFWEALEQCGPDAVPALVKRVFAAAMAGDMAAARMVLDRIIPARKGTPFEIQLTRDGSPYSGNLREAIEVVLEQGSNGQLSAEEVSDWVGGFDMLRRTIETDDLKSRVIALENGDAR